jgi:hypothetical protein
VPLHYLIGVDPSPEFCFVMWNGSKRRLVSRHHLLGLALQRYSFRKKSQKQEQEQNTYYVHISLFSAADIVFCTTKGKTLRGTSQNASFLSKGPTQIYGKRKRASLDTCEKALFVDI